MKLDSPLRYPGGKGRLAPFFMDLLDSEGLTGGWYCEPYAGGAGVALALMFGEYVERIHINDLDPAVFAFWKSALDATDDFLRLVRDTPVTVDEWKRQRAIYREGPSVGRLQLGFAMFFLNRTSRSGIVGTGGIIGGLAQKGKWKVGARYSRRGLTARIERVARFRTRIEVTCLDAADLLMEVVPELDSNGLVYLDPPYYRKADRLYEASYRPEDHAAVAKIVRELDKPWVVTYDDVPETRALYSGELIVNYRLDYTAARRRVGREVMFAAPFFTSSLRTGHTLLRLKEGSSGP